MAVKTEYRLNQTALDKQLRRLRGFNKFAEFAEELKRVVNRHAANDEHVTRIIDLVLDQRRPNEDGFCACPTPAEMSDYCHDVPDDPSGLVAPDEECRWCGGTGWMTRIINGLSGAEICDCRKAAERVG